MPKEITLKALLAEANSYRQMIGLPKLKIKEVKQQKDEVLLLVETN